MSYRWRWQNICSGVARTMGLWQSPNPQIVSGNRMMGHSRHWASWLPWTYRNGGSASRNCNDAPCWLYCLSVLLPQTCLRTGRFLHFGIQSCLCWCMFPFLEICRAWVFSHISVAKIQINIGKSENLRKKLWKVVFTCGRVCSYSLSRTPDCRQQWTHQANPLSGDFPFSRLLFNT